MDEPRRERRSAEALFIKSFLYYLVPPVFRRGCELRSRSALLQLGVCVALIGVGGCYYEVRDSRTGRLYYTDQWVAADGYRGPLTITDESGAKVRIQNAHVLRLNREDYLQAVESRTADPHSPKPPGTEAPAAGARP